jgi:uncharacterized protein YbjQ (UPF0145 family)
MQMSTTDTIPGPARVVQKSGLVWSAGHKSLSDAQEALANYLGKQGWDACIGVRFAAHPHEVYAYHQHNGITDSLRWTIYGTAVKFA